MMSLDRLVGLQRDLRRVSNITITLIIFVLIFLRSGYHQEDLRDRTIVVTDPVEEGLNSILGLEVPPEGKADLVLGLETLDGSL